MTGICLYLLQMYLLPLLLDVLPVAVSALFFLGTGELFPDGVALFPGPSSHEDVEEPDSSSDDSVGGWSPVCVD